MHITKHIRGIIYLFVLNIGLVPLLFPRHDLALTQWYGLMSLALLYLTLLISPFYQAYPQFPGRATSFRAQKALGISSFLLALPHAYLGFLGFIQKFENLRYTQGSEMLSLVVGVLALSILGALAFASRDKFKQRLHRFRKALYRGIYMAALLVLIHATTITIHSVNIRAYMLVAYALFFVLFSLQIVRLGHILRERWRVPEFVTRSIGFPGVALMLLWMLPS